MLGALVLDFCNSSTLYWWFLAFGIPNPWMMSVQVTMYFTADMPVLQQ